MRPIGHLPKCSVVQTTVTSVQFSLNESSLSMPLILPDGKHFAIHKEDGPGPSAGLLNDTAPQLAHGACGVIVTEPPALVVNDGVSETFAKLLSDRTIANPLEVDAVSASNPIIALRAKSRKSRICIILMMRRGAWSEGHPSPRPASAQAEVISQSNR